MNCYETLFVLKPTLTDEETTAQIAKIKDVLAKENAELLAADDMGMRKLAYQVQKNDRGYYTVLYYKAEGNTIEEIERNLKINEEVIKFLTLKYTNTKEVAQFNKLVEATATKPEPTPAEVTPTEEVATEEAPKEEPAETVETETVETTEA